MKKSKSFITLIIFVFSLFSFKNVDAQSMVIGTYNIRYDNPNDKGNLWVDRAPVIGSLIRFHGYEIIGMQEVLKNQLDDLGKMLPEFAHYGVGRDNGISEGEHSVIFYKKDRFDLMDSGDFWLSQTPEKVGPGWDANLNRICSWVKLKEKNSKKVFYVFNAHYDHEGVEARRESSKLVLAKIKSIAKGQPAIFMGDLNGGRESECYKTLATSTLLHDIYDITSMRYANNGTFNAFGNNIQKDNIIDHIFVTKSFSSMYYGILTDTYMGKYPSDHFPVLVEVSFR